MFQVQAVLEEKFPELKRKPAMITRPALALLRKMAREQEVNDFLAQNAGLEGIEFIDRILEHFNFSYSVDSGEIENIPAEGRVVIVANHPLGLLDGIALLKMVSRVRKDVRIVANDILMRFDPLHPLLLPVANLGAGYNKDNVRAIHDALANDEAVIIFPSGEVSRAGLTGIKDGRWQAGFLRFAEQAKAPLLPIHLGGRNSAFFYGVSTVFKPLSTLMLFSEAMRQRNVKLPVHVGELIAWKEIAALDVPREQKVRRILRQLYGISKPNRPASVLAFKTEKPVAHPESRLDLRRELRDSERLGLTSDGKEIYLFNARGNSAVMRELGRLREIAFRQVGEGTGKRRDIDSFDTYYKHVVLWDETEMQIVGAYRIGEAQDILARRGAEGLYTHTLFSFEDGLRRNFEQSLELGRSFVQPRYQGLRSLDSLWQGIGAYLATRPQVRYLFGPVSVSGGYPEEARKLLVYFYQRYFGLPERMASARLPFTLTEADEHAAAAIIPGGDYTRSFSALKHRLNEMGVAVPTLYKQYTELCDEGGAHFLAFGVDPAFSGCIDGLVRVDLLRLKASKRERYLRSPLTSAPSIPAGELKSA